MRGRRFWNGGERMNSAATVDNLINNWKTMGLTKAEMAVKVAEACMGWPYVWGGYGQYDTPSNRKSYAERSSCPAGEKEQIRKKCQVLNGTRSDCSGCKYYPGAKVRFFDCRGFTRWVLQQEGITISGAGATSQWNTNSNWSEKGTISNLPMDKVCCVFMQDGTKMSHTGLHIGGGIVIALGALAAFIIIRRIFIYIRDYVLMYSYTIYYFF